MTRSRRKPTTNEYYRLVLDNALREQWKVSSKAISKAKIDRTKRLATLYGYNASAKIVKERASISPRPSTDNLLARSTSLPNMIKSTNDNRNVTGKSGFNDSFADIGGLLDSQHDNQNLPARGGIAPQHSVLSGKSASSYVKKGMLGPIRYSRPVSRRSQKKASTSPNNKSNYKSKSKNKVKLPPHPRCKSPQHYLNKAKKHLNQRLADSPSRLEEVKPKPHPWYVGYSNSANVPPASYEANAVRYGAVGALQVEKLHRPNDRSIDFGAVKPRFLGHDAVINEYTENLYGSPMTWPDFARYVCGSKLKEYSPRAELTEHIKYWVDTNKEGMDDFNKSVNKERSNARSLYQESCVLHPPLEVDRMGRPVNAHNHLLQESKRLRYWPGLTVMYTEEKEETSLGKQIEERKKQYENRIDVLWKESFYLYKVVRNFSTQRRPGLEDFERLVKEARAAALEDHENSVHLSREGFVSAIKSAFEIVSVKRLNRLYSLFDPDRIDKVDYRILLASQRCFWKLSTETIKQKIISLFRLFEPPYLQIADGKYVEPVYSRDVVKAILCLCSANNDERKAMEKSINQVLQTILDEETEKSEMNAIHLDELESALQRDQNGDQHIIATFKSQLSQRLPEQVATLIQD